jgi:hypothetical protein
MKEIVIGDTPEQLGQIEAADAMMIDGKIVTKADYLALAAQVEVLNQRVRELSEKVKTACADALDAEADLIISAPADAYISGKGWAGAQARLAERIGSMMKARAALIRAGGA